MEALAVLASMIALAAMTLLGDEGERGVRLECRLEAASTAPSGGPVLVRFVLRNKGRRAVSVLDWQTPLEGLLGDLFSIAPAGGGPALRYEGPLVKRGEPQPDEYRPIPAGSELSEEVDLSAAYDLTLAGRYTVTLRGPIRDVTDPASAPRPRDRHVAVPVSCNTLEVEILPKSGR